MPRLRHLTGCRTRAAASAIPASAEGSGHSLPGSGSADAAPRPAACAPVLADACLAPPPAAEPAWNADFARAADAAARAPLPASLAGGAMRAPAATAPPTPVAAAPMATRAGSADSSTGHCASAELWRTGDEARGDAGAEDPERQQGERGQHDDQRVVNRWLGGMDWN